MYHVSCRLNEHILIVDFQYTAFLFKKQVKVSNLNAWNSMLGVKNKQIKYFIKLNFSLCFAYL